MRAMYLIVYIETHMHAHTYTHNLQSVLLVILNGTQLVTTLVAER